MNIELFIARRIIFDKENKSGVSRRIVSIATLGMALSLAVMIVSVAIVTGFKREIRNKVTGFGAHLQIVNYDSNASFETVPINKNQSFYPLQNTSGNLRHTKLLSLTKYLRKPTAHASFCHKSRNNKNNK
jgi:lipoprotein-releasing system permease protein